jgi:hypothetical protein
MSVDLSGMLDVHGDSHQGGLDLQVSGQSPAGMPARHSPAGAGETIDYVDDVMNKLQEDIQPSNTMKPLPTVKKVHHTRSCKTNPDRMGGGGAGLMIQGQGTKTTRGQINVTGSLTKARDNKPKDMEMVWGSSEDTGPPACGAYKAKKDIAPTQFKAFYERGDLPISLDCNVHGTCTKWHHHVEIEKLDYHHYLPLFFDGLRERKVQLYTIATMGANDMVDKAPHKTLAVIPQLIIPIKEALNTRDRAIVCRTLILLQKLVKCHQGIGEALVPYYRQLLPALNILKNKNTNTGDAIDYGQKANTNVGQLINETLTLLEQYGGADAFINIKYMVPTYESCIFN